MTRDRVYTATDTTPRPLVIMCIAYPYLYLYKPIHIHYACMCVYNMHIYVFYICMYYGEKYPVWCFRENDFNVHYPNNILNILISKSKSNRKTKISIQIMYTTRRCLWWVTSYKPYILTEPKLYTAHNPRLYAEVFVKVSKITQSSYMYIVL
jgi:hypothetical protein